jgi:molybdopterin-containing oxidoreductase family membrane subunit
VFLEFIWKTLKAMAKGSSTYYRWVGFLVACIALGVAAYVYQLDNGLVVTNMTDQVSWGAYIANFTFLVGAAAAAVMLVIPAYLYRDSALKEVVVLGELLAIAAIIMCLLFVTVDIGRPDRFWHLIPGLGRFNWPISLLSWDVIVLFGYLILNSYITTYLLYVRFKGGKPDRHKYRPVVYVAIPWAIGIHTVTAFLYAGFGSRPHWNAAVLAPRFLASAFAAGPALVIIALTLVRDRMAFPVKDAALARLRQIAAVAMMINLFMFGSEVFTELYSQKSHVVSMYYHLFGLPGHRILVPFTWTGVALDAFALVVFVTQRLYEKPKLLIGASAAAVVGVWIEKGMGLVIPGFVPTPLGDVVDYSPSFTEFCVSVGVWATGILVYTLLLKVAVPIEKDELKSDRVGAEAPAADLVEEPGPEAAEATA